jgi:hypothetical protein
MMGNLGIVSAKSANSTPITRAYGDYIILNNSISY